MHFLIYILDNNVGIFMDMIYMFVEAMKQDDKQHTYEIKNCPRGCTLESNCSSHLPANFNDDKQRLVIFGTDLGRHNIPNNSIICTFDCWAVMKTRLDPLLANNVVMTYSDKDIQDVKQAHSNARIYKFGFGYSSHHDMYQPMNKQFDACLLGCWSQRRQNVCQEIGKQNVRIVFPHNQSFYNEARAQLYNSCKIVLAIYNSDMLMEQTSASRIIPAVCNGAFVIAEKSTDPSVNDFLQPFCVLCTKEEMPNIVKYFTTQDAEREQLRAQFYQQMKQCFPKIDFAAIKTSHLNST